MILLDLFFGLVALLMIYQLYCFLRYRGSDYLYFIFFILSVSLFIGVIAGTGSDLLPLLKEATPRYALGFGILLVGSSMYYRFIRFFCEAGTHYPVFSKITVFVEYIQLVTGFLLITETLVWGQPGYMKVVAQAVYLLNSAFQLYMIIFLILTRKVYKIMLAVGGSIMIILIKWVLVPVALTGREINELRLFTYLLLGILVNFIFIAAAFLVRGHRPVNA